MSRRAARAARQVILDAGVTAPPVDVRELAISLGARVQKADLDDDTSGMLLTKAGRKPLIVINEGHPRNRQRFSIGHELGHMLLHRVGKVHVDHVSYRNQASSTGELLQEREANAFAAELLMPEDLVRERFQAAGVHPYNLDDDDLYRLAREFEVSVQAMTFRLMNLELLDG